MTAPVPEGPSLSPVTVSVRDARVLFGGEALFDGLDVTLEGGHWTCVLGPSGVGKSTLLRLILGLAGNGGTVSCDDGGSVAGRAAFMAQDALLFPWLTVQENVTVGARLRGQGADPDRARDLLAGVGLGGAAALRPAALSGGMRQRTALARTLMENRPVVLMDEPFSALDAITRVRLQNLAARLLMGRTVLLVTHDPLEALRLGHRIHVLAGSPAHLGPPLVPAGEPPRAVDDAEVLSLQGELLKRLAEAQAR
jgi:putative hydroxymethylpyrimidine transport system ATP-binding protein